MFPKPTSGPRVVSELPSHGNEVDKASEVVASSDWELLGVDEWQRICGDALVDPAVAVEELLCRL